MVRTEGALSLPAGLIVRNHELVQTEAFVSFVQTQKALQQQIDDGWQMLQEMMEAKHIDTIKGDWGYITLAERVTLSCDTTLPPRFYKQTLDPAKLRAHKTIHGVFPEGVQQHTTTYLAKKVVA